MSRIAAIFALTVSILIADLAHADERNATNEYRNPISWLLDDIGKLLPTAPQADEKAATSEEIENNNPITSLFERLAKLFKPTAPSEHAETPSAPPATEVVEKSGAVVPAENDQEVVETAASEPVGADERNPISWLLSDLAKIFQPDLTIDQGHSSVSTVSETPDATVEVEPATETADTTTPAVEPDQAPLPNAPALTTEQRNPVSWLLSDIAGLFEAVSAPATEVSESASVTETIAKSDSLSASEPVETSPPEEDVPETANVSVEVTPNEPPAPQLKAAANEATVTSLSDIETLPSQRDLHVGIFDPEAPLFDKDIDKLPPLAPSEPTEGSPQSAEREVAELSSASIIRQRPKYQPEQKNHRKLGEDHKAVTKEQETNLFANFLDNIFGIDDPGIPEESVSNKVSDRIVPEEKLQLGYTSPDAPELTPSTELTSINGGPLKDRDLYLGKNAAIGVPYKKFVFDPGTCVERNVQVSVFCLNHMDWPVDIAKSFNADTAFLMPGEGIIRFENGLTSRVYSVFKASAFHDVVKFMQRRFGPPQEREVGWMHMLEAPRLPNTTFRWLALSADRADTIVLEVRNYDDLRRSFADMDHGMVRLYRQGSRPIFKHLSTMDLMLMQRRRVANVPVEPNTPPKQK